MCSSDEFYFFPITKKSTIFLNVLDSLDKQKIRQNISFVKKLQQSLEKIDCRNENLELQIDSVLLKQSMCTFLREFEKIKIWQLDPTLYLKIFLLGVEYITTRFSFIEPRIDDMLLARIRQIPRLLNEAEANLKEVPHLYLKKAIELTNSSIEYFKSLPFPLRNKGASFREFNSLIKKTIKSLEDFKRFLEEKEPHQAYIKDPSLLEDVLKDSFSYDRGLEEIFEIAHQEYTRTIRELKTVAKQIHPNKKWQQILSGYRIEVKGTKQLLNLYSSEIKKIKNFFKEKKVIPIPKTQTVLVKETPKFMKPIRASASYSCPVGIDRRQQAFFYITFDFDKIAQCTKLGTSIHNEYVFVTAHETYPGHHLLDSIRRSLRNSIRQQIESALFYEGWASYTEGLVVQLGYVKQPIQRLVGLKRQAWRAIRAMLDVGIRINKLNLQEAKKMLKDLGYSDRIVKSMVLHYVLNPGYQLCYTIGKFEIERLKDRFAPKMGLREFHHALLESGQIPFDLIEKKMERLSWKKNS